jgi:cytochrome P450
MKMLKNMLQERREMPRKQQTDFFDYVIEELRKEGTMLTEAIALDLMFVLLFASFETTSLALTYAIKQLSDNPLVFKQLQVSYRYIILSESLELFFMALQDISFDLPQYCLLGRT